MIRIAIRQAAFEAIAATLPLGSVGYVNKTDEHGNACPRWIGRWWIGCVRCGAWGRAPATWSYGSRARRPNRHENGTVSIDLNAIALQKRRVLQWLTPDAVAALSH